MENTIRELVIKVQLKSGRAVMLYEDITELEKEDNTKLTEEMLFEELDVDQATDSVKGRTQTGNVVVIPNHAIDYIEMNIQERTKETV